MQFTSGPYQRSVDIPNAKRGAVQTPTSQHAGVGGTVVPGGGLRRSPRVRPTGIGLHLNSLTSAVPFKREYPASGDGFGIAAGGLCEAEGEAVW
jgi:hypothetical protein